jgi:hypothetical protein
MVHPIFNDVGPVQLSDIASYLELQELRTGEVLFRENDRGQNAYMILRGSLSSHKLKSEELARRKLVYAQEMKERKQRAAIEAEHARKTAELLAASRETDIQETPRTYNLLFFFFFFFFVNCCDMINF